MMTQDRVKKSVSTALATAGICAVVFAICLFIYFFVSIAMVMGDGTAPKITHITAAILDFTVKLLGISSNGAVFTVVLFWASIVFVLVFVFMLLIKIAALSADNHSDNRTQRYIAILSVVVFCMVCYIIYTSRQHERAMIEEKKLALEFVKLNRQVMQEAGGNGTVFLASYNMVHDKPVYYVFAIHGVKTIHAIVEVSRNSGRPVFTLACTKSLHMGQLDPYRHPCRQ